MTLTGSVTDKGALTEDGQYGSVTVTLRGANDLGDHVTGAATVLLPVAGDRRRVMALSHSFSGSTAIACIGATEFSKDSGRWSSGWPSRRSPLPWPTLASPRPR